MEPRRRVRPEVPPAAWLSRIEVRGLPVVRSIDGDFYRIRVSVIWIDRCPFDQDQVSVADDCRVGRARDSKRARLRVEEARERAVAHAEEVAEERQGEHHDEDEADRRLPDHARPTQRHRTPPAKGTLDHKRSRAEEFDGLNTITKLRCI